MQEIQLTLKLTDRQRDRQTKTVHSLSQNLFNVMQESQLTLRLTDRQRGRQAKTLHSLKVSSV